MTLDPNDRAAITELLSKYALYIDARRVDEWMDLWEPDAVIEVDDGRPIIRTETDRRNLAVTAPVGVHMSAFPIIGETDVVSSVVTQQSFLFYDLGKMFVKAGWYDDIVVKRNGKWRFSSRMIRFFGG